MKKRFKTILIMLLAILMLFPAASYAAPKEAGIMVYLDGYSMSFEVPPVIEKGTTLVPMKNILEPLGYEFQWEPNTKTIRILETISEYHHVLTSLTIDSTKVVQHEAMGYWGDDGLMYTKDLAHEEYNLAVPARLINGRTMVPLRFIAEMSGYKITWDAENRIVNIMSPEYVPDTISDEQRAINEQYVTELNDLVKSNPEAFQ